ncbi:MAG: autotransporter outer membrane beta-barrel domain-containing protein [Marinibacterium sp.]
MTRLRHNPGGLGWVCAALISLGAALMPGWASGQPTLDAVFKQLQRQNAEGSMAILSLVGIPDDSASTIVLGSGQTGREYDYKQSQIGGGFRLAKDIPLYLEGYAGYARYDPVLFFQSGGSQTSTLPLKWTSAAATGGIGWEFDLGEHVKFRPMVHVSLGRTQSDASVAAQAIANRLGLDASFLESGGIWAGGLGASATLAYDRRWPSDHQFEARLRFTHLEYRPVGDDKDLIASATAANAVFWTRYRFPTGWRLFNRPVRGVTDASISYLGGDQSKVLRTKWLGRVGIGGEIDLSETFVPWVSTTRLMVRYYGSDTVSGFSAGIGISF